MAQSRSYYVDWRMLRDVKRRKLAYEYADERLRINAIRKNTLLPKELQVPRPPAHTGTRCCDIVTSVTPAALLGHQRLHFP